MSKSSRDRASAGDTAPAPRSRAYYPGKVPAARVGQLTPLGNLILDALLARTRRSTGDIWEKLLREHGADVTFDDAA